MEWLKIAKWIEFVIKIGKAFQWLLPGNAGLSKRLEEIEVLKETVNVLEGNLSTIDKGKAIFEAVSKLEGVKKFNKRALKKLLKTKNRILDKLSG